MSGSEPLYTYQQCARIDQLSIQSGLSGQQLMGQAAVALLQALRHDGYLDGRPIYIVCGHGNNGGDGLALAWTLLGATDRDYRQLLSVFVTKEPATREGRYYFDLLKKAGQTIQDARSFPGLKPAATLILEALLGAGQNRPAEGIFLELLEAFLVWQKAGASIVSIDLPCGLTETAPYLENLPRPERIYTLGVKKLALAFLPDIPASVLPIGFVPADFAPAAREISVRDSRTFFARRPLDHKYSAGSAAVIGGSAGMRGALLLAGRAFFAAGGGILAAWSPGGDLLAVEPSFIQTEGTDILSKKITVLLIGPGLSLSDLNQERPAILRVLQEKGTDLQGVILDAAAIDLIRDAEYPAALRERTVITPHHGEFSRMIGPPPACAQKALNAAQLIAELGVWCIIKGPTLCLLSPRGELEILPAALPALAVAGSGDVFAGILLAAVSRSCSLTLVERIRMALGLQHELGREGGHPLATELINRISGAPGKK